MKKHLTICAAAAMLLTACQSDDDSNKPKARKDIDLTRSEQAITTAGNEFAFNFFRTVTENEEKENVFISPLSASIALSMTANGAQNNTLNEMVNTLGFKDFTLEELNNYYQKLTNALLAVDNTTSLGLANSIWIKNGFEVKTPFIDANRLKYDAQVEYLDFASPKALETINGWCADKTNKRITKVLDFIDPDARLFLINALYFKGTWVCQFEKKNTHEGPFTDINGATHPMELMQQVTNLPYTADEDVQILEMPYGNEAFSMVVVLPQTNKDIDAVIANLTPDTWNRWMETLGTKEVDVMLPKFKLEYERDLIDDLTLMGINDAFSATAADFGAMSAAELHIGLVKQNTFVEVNEEGTEAAAVTVVGMIENAAGPDPGPITFHATRPFLYIIKEKSTGAILFMGKMGEGI